MDREDEEEHELARDAKQEKPVPPGQMQSHPGSQAEGQIASYSEEEEMNIFYSEEEIASFKTFSICLIRKVQAILTWMIFSQLWTHSTGTKRKYSSC
mmetsp:Transcript_10451/g.10306  ORF Transcript_10451/g.10306 Transcript_10451/m.10306 type:complete len:97 (-) Transcript_10451:1280-1570(-)